MAKFLFTFGAGGPAEAAHDAVIEQLGPLLGSAPGARRAVTNEVIRQLVTLPLLEPGQRYGGGYLEIPQVAFIDEFYFDNQDVGIAFFARSEVRVLLGRTNTPDVRGFAVREWVGFDRR
jgi:hypothetical protein